MNKVYAFQIKNLNVLKGEGEEWISNSRTTCFFGQYFNSLNSGKWLGNYETALCVF